MPKLRTVSFVDKDLLAKVSPKKRKLFKEGVRLSWDWLRAHEIELPGLIVTAHEEWIAKENLGCYYNVRVREVVVNVAHCYMAKRVFNRPNHANSFEDWTPLGVVCHEIGHHVDRTLGRAKGRGWLSETAEWVDIIHDEASVACHETDHMEAFAEAFRLFLTNPELLWRGRPERYNFMVSLRFFPVKKMTPWRKVLKDTPPEFKAAVERWIARGHK